MTDVKIGLYSDEELASFKSPESGEHKDTGKSRVDLIPPLVLMDVGEVFAYGCKKYSENNWRKGIKWMRLYGSILRHGFKWASGEDKDPESGLHHLAHLICDGMMLLDLVRLKPELDNR